MYHQEVFDEFNYVDSIEKVPGFLFDHILHHRDNLVRVLFPGGPDFVQTGTVVVWLLAFLPASAFSLFGWFTLFRHLFIFFNKCLYSSIHRKIFMHFRHPDGILLGRNADVFQECTFGFMAGHVHNIQCRHNGKIQVGGKAPSLKALITKVFRAFVFF